MFEIRSYAYKPRKDAWTTLDFHCPHCKKVFKQKEMWSYLVNNYKTTTAISDLLGCSKMTVLKNARRHKLEYLLQGTNENSDWNKIALKLGFKNAREMFYKFKVTKNMSWVHMARHMDYKVEKLEELKKACKMFLNPAFGDLKTLKGKVSNKL